ncbi:MFS transporter [Orrella daihaiensis]|uniref:MFS transporter n=1 Tax=Orrella daihaiensis TaxID=2782176 RepID=A0ABY4AMF4_9BURK|nr:MFS transporter [Orrella daihaiensis]UOD51354.1 MFS transporter [Orrella daihaiensis]
MTTDRPESSVNQAAAGQTNASVAQVHTITLKIFLSFALGYFLSYALRSVNATIAPLLEADLNLGPGALGWLSSAYFLSFASVQWYLGTWLDRFGSRRTESMLLGTAALGSVVMALSDTLVGLSAGRILVGLGVAACLMAPYSYYRRVFAPQKQAQLAMWMLIAGTSGALAATQPALILAEWLGWRDIFLITAGLLAFSALAIFLFVPDHDLAATAHGQKLQSHPAKAATALPMTLMQLLRHPIMVRIIPTTIFFSGGFVALQSLWVGPWMTNVLGLSLNATGKALLYFNAALLVAYLTMSVVSPKLEARGITLARQTTIGFCWFVGCMLLILIWQSPTAWWAWLVMAPGIPAVILIQTQTALMFPKAIAGRVLTTFNLVMFAGAFAVQWGVGLLADLFALMGSDPARALWLAFAVLLIFQVISLWWFLSRDKPISVDTDHG